MSTKRTVLVPKILAEVRASNRIRNLIAISLNNSANTVGTWARNNDPYLCLPDSMKVIKEEIPLPDGESYTCEVEIGDKHLSQS